MVLALSACASGTSIGGSLKDAGSESIAPTESPTPKAKPKKKKKAEPKVEETQAPKVKTNTIIIAVRDNFTGFEYKLPDKKGWTPATDGGPAAFVGDTIIFKNMDSEGFNHSWVNEAGGGFKEGKLFDSGTLKPGQQFTWEVTDDPGEYRYKDGVVPYRAAVGPLVILERS